MIDVERTNVPEWLWPYLGHLSSPDKKMFRYDPNNRRTRALGCTGDRGDNGPLGYLTELYRDVYGGMPADQIKSRHSHTPACMDDFKFIRFIINHQGAKARKDGGELLIFFYQRELPLRIHRVDEFKASALIVGLEDNYHSLVAYLFDQGLTLKDLQLEMYIRPKNLSLIFLTLRYADAIEWLPNIHTLSTTPKEQQIVLTLFCIRNHTDNTPFNHISNELLFIILSDVLRIV